jgi:methionyl-tRNA formyltransferase
MNMALALDAGDILSQVKTPIDPNETVEQLHDRLAVLGAELLGETVPKLAAGSITPIPQDDALSNYAPMLSRALSPIDWTHSAKQIHDQVRGLIPWPAASAVLGETQFKIFQVEETGQETNQKPGTVISTDKKGILVSCGDGKVLRILEVQASGGKRMRAADYLRGHPIL